MNWAIVIAMGFGFSVGNLPDHGPWWAGIKVAFVIVMLVLVVHSARRERRSGGEQS